MTNAQRNIKTCNSYQCKKKQWCKRYQLYLQNKDKGNVDTSPWCLPWKSIAYFKDIEQTKLHQLIDTCEYFMPTEQYIIKEKLNKL